MQKKMKTMMRNGQTTAEYAIVLAVVIGAIMAMQVYVKRGMNAQVRESVEQLTQAGTSDRPWLTDPSVKLPAGGVRLKRSGGQYEPYYAESKGDIVRDSEQTDDINLAGNTITRSVKGTASASESSARKANSFTKQRTWTEAD